MVNDIAITELTYVKLQQFKKLNQGRLFVFTPAVDYLIVLVRRI